ncbi:MAG: acylneuraminate cytidylyltransferase family protein [Deltaproteobacteria bacterium]|nr:acylneuraminate cytidylyltransferase family protein [Deltaproteobacteria bacterium]
MSRNDLNILAVVPARGGSKGIPRKNLQKVSGLSLIARAAQVAKSLDWIDAAIISTDDHEMAEEGRKHGLDVPFIRPVHLASDTALGIDVWRHAWLACEEHYGKRFDISIKLEPTSPLRRPKDVERTVRTVIEEDHPAAATVSPTPAHFSPHKTLKVSDQGIIGFYLQDGAKFSLRQGIPQYYHRNGICYAATREHVVEKGMIIDHETAAVIIERPVVNIDELYELELAEWLLNRKQR